MSESSSTIKALVSGSKQSVNLPSQRFANERHSPESLRLALIEAQYTLRDTRNKPRGRGVLILMSGMELAGKGEALTQLRGWADPRLFKVKARLPVPPHSPLWLQDAALLPEKGEIVILFGSWYGDLLQARMTYLQEQKRKDAKNTKKINKEKSNVDHSLVPEMTSERFRSEVERLHAFEQDLRAQGITVCKCWFDLSWERLQERLDTVKKSEEHWLHLHGLDWRKKDQYDELVKLRADLGIDWIDINGQDPTERDLEFGHIVLSALREPRLPTAPANRRWKSAEIPAALLAPDQAVLEKETYKARLKDAQAKLAKLVHQCDRRSIVLVFEGMDAAGKGGTISRIVEPLDPRQYQVFPISAPEPHEMRHPYLWRFWSKLPVPDFVREHAVTNLSIFDRSWYGRVLVERVEGFVRAGEWQSAYAEINHFERDLTSGGTIIIKFWLSISSDEQERRFMARQETPHKRFKITSDDWRNRKRWDDYLQAAADVFAQTNTLEAPWIIVATDDKLTARLAVLESLNRRLEAVLKS
ncbi:MAG: phosphate--AMP phosphotransferase [Gammaproteobacteria bacterium]|nr:phosphate--AMP phosphotransferase [Gammaproteobacteria bacterium]